MGFLRDDYLKLKLEIMHTDYTMMNKELHRFFMPCIVQKTKELQAMQHGYYLIWTKLTRKSTYRHPTTR